MMSEDLKRIFKLKAGHIQLDVNLTAPKGTPVEHIVDKIRKFDGFIQNPDQTKFEFDATTTLSDAVIAVADKPKTADYEFEFRVKVTGASMEDRSTLYALAQSGAKLTLKVIQPEEPKKTGKKGKAGETKADSAETNAAKAETDQPAAETADHSVDANKTAQADGLSTVDAALVQALREAPFNQVTGTPYSDEDIRNILAEGWEIPITGVTDDGFNFLAIGNHGRQKEPKLYIGEKPQLQPPVNGKPALKGQYLIERVRKLEGLVKPETTKSGKGH